MEQTSDATGNSLSFFGKSVASYNGLTAVAQNGGVNVYYNSSEDIWELQSTITNSESGFGQKVAISDNYLAVSTNTGRVYIYQKSGINWVPATKVSNGYLTGTTASFGTDFKFIGNYFIIGEPAVDYLGVIQAGEVCVFSTTGNPWTCVADIHAPTPRRKGFFGSAIDANATYILIGVPSAQVSGVNSAGAAYLYQFGSYSVPVKTLISSSPFLNAQFGESVSINNDNHILIGAPSEKIKMNQVNGKAYLFQYSTGDWSISSTLLPSPLKQYGSFAKKVKLSDSGFAIVGQPGYDGASANQGRIYVYSNLLISTATTTIDVGIIGPSLLVGNVFDSTNSFERELVIGIPNYSGNGKYSGLVAFYSSYTNVVYYGEDELYSGDDRIIYSNNINVVYYGEDELYSGDDQIIYGN